MGLRRLFTRRKELAYDGWIKLVDLLSDLAVFVFQPQRKRAQAAFFFKSLLSQRYRQRSGQVALAIRSLIAVPFGIPGINSGLAEVIRQPLVVLREQYKILRDLFAGVVDFVQREDGHDALAFRILCDVLRHIEIQRPS